MKAQLLTYVPLTLALICSGWVQVAHATPDFEEPAPVWAEKINPLRVLPAAEAFSRAQAVLLNFGVPTEPESQNQADALHGLQSPEGIRTLLKSLDPSGSFSKFSSLETDGSLINIFQDPASRQTPDFSVRLNTSGTAPEPTPFEQRLILAARNPQTRPLAGLRIALDPGHMGGNIWDERTGKFIHNRAGNIMSEGVIALQTALLLEPMLQELGAEVQLTRRTLDSVSKLPFETYDQTPFAKEELRESVLLPWFQNLLSTGPAGPTLYRAFANNSDFKAIFAESSRTRHFVINADLQARADLIEQFSPDITLIIHFDTGAWDTVNPGYDGTKAYVPGAFSYSEFSSRSDRLQFAQHLLNPTVWESSRMLGRAILNQIRDGLGVPFDRNGGGNALQIEPGLFARNLNLNRKLVGSAVSYVECFYYNDPREFSALSKPTHPMVIGGEDHPYSDRLVQLTQALKDGVVNFVRQYPQREFLLEERR